MIEWHKMNANNIKSGSSHLGGDANEWIDGCWYRLPYKRVRIQQKCPKSLACASFQNEHLDINFRNAHAIQELKQDINESKHYAYVILDDNTNFKLGHLANELKAKHETSIKSYS